MRPEYIDAVNAAKYGPLFWTILILPAGIIWLTSLLRIWTEIWIHLSVCVIAFVASVAMACSLILAHAFEIQAVKEEMMQTPAETEDWASDAWRVFAPFVAAILSILYCGLHQFFALTISYTIHALHSLRRTAYWATAHNNP